MSKIFYYECQVTDGSLETELFPCISRLECKCPDPVVVLSTLIRGLLEKFPDCDYSGWKERVTDLKTGITYQCSIDINEFKSIFGDVRVMSDSEVYYGKDRNI